MLKESAKPTVSCPSQSIILELQMSSPDQRIPHSPCGAYQSSTTIILVEAISPRVGTVFLLLEWVETYPHY